MFEIVFFLVKGSLEVAQKQTQAAQTTEDSANIE